MRGDQHLAKLTGLAPFLRDPATEFLARVRRDVGVRLCVVYGWRSLEEQESLYRQGRAYDPATQSYVVADPQRIVTRAVPGTTAHNVLDREGHAASVALDVIPMDESGTLLWETPREQWASIYTIAWRCGLDPMGDQIGAYLRWDLGHFEEPAWALKIAGLGYHLPAWEPPETRQGHT